MQHVERIMDDNVNILVDITSCILYSKDLHLISFKGEYVDRLVHMYMGRRECLLHKFPSLHISTTCCALSQVLLIHSFQKKETPLQYM